MYVGSIRVFELLLTFAFIEPPSSPAVASGTEQVVNRSVYRGPDIDARARFVTWILVLTISRRCNNNLDIQYALYTIQ